MPLYFIVLVPILAAIVSGWLCDDELGDGANSVISTVVLACLAWLWSLIGGRVIIADQATNIVAIAAFSLALISPISPLYFVRQWLIVRVKSPLAALPTITISVRQPSLPPTEQRSSSGLHNPGQRWTAKPPLTPPPTTWRPSREASGIHQGDTASIPAVALPPTPSSQPLTLRPPMYPPYPQKGTPYS